MHNLIGHFDLPSHDIVLNFHFAGKTNLVICIDSGNQLFKVRKNLKQLQGKADQNAELNCAQERPNFGPPQLKFLPEPLSL